MGVQHQLHVGADTPTCRSDPRFGVLERKPITTNHSHFHGVKAFGSISGHLGLGLVARRPTAAAVATDVVTDSAERLVNRHTEYLRLHIPHGQINTRNSFNSYATAAVLRLRITALKSGLPSRSVVHFFPYKFGEQGVFSEHRRAKIELYQGRHNLRIT